MTGYTKLFSSIVTSSIWTEDDQTRIVWVTMLALADMHGEVHASIPGLARVSGVSIDACEKAIAKCLSPDAYSRTPDDEGRRIAPIDGGWEIINHCKYRMMASKDDQKQKTAERVRRHRKRNVNALQSVTVTGGNDLVTQGRDIAEAEAEAEAEKTKTGDGAAKPPRSKFVPPTREELDLAAAKLGMIPVEVDKFASYYGANGWRVGKNAMKSWQHALAGWHSRSRSFHHGFNRQSSERTDMILRGDLKPVSRPYDDQ